MKMKIFKPVIPLFLLCSAFLYAETITTVEENIEQVEYVEPNVDCLILEDENSIICKFEITRNTEDKSIIVQWIAPNGEISRSRDMIILAGHGSIYDYRYIQGRELGLWTFKVIYEEKEYSTQFELK